MNSADFIMGLSIAALGGAAFYVVGFVTVVIHEAGHWLAAKALGLYAPAFSLSPPGEPYRVIGRAFGTEFRWSWRWHKGAGVFIMTGHTSGDDLAEMAESEAQTGFKAPSPVVLSWWQPACVSAAGPLANLFAAVAGFVMDYCLAPPLQGLDFRPLVITFALLLLGCYNVTMGIANLCPLDSTFDGYKILAAFRKRSKRR